MTREHGDSGETGRAVLRSVASPAAVRERVSRLWGVEPDEPVLMRSLVNDVWRVTAGTTRFAVKVYRAGRWSVEQVAWEQDLATLLHREGVTDIAPVPLVDGELVGVMRAPEGDRPVVMLTWSEAGKPGPPFDDDVYARFGELAGRFHEVAASLRSSHEPRTYTLDSTLEAPIARVGRALQDLGRSTESELVRRKGTRALAALHELDDAGLRRGVRHGDVSLDNVLSAPAGLFLHDFDLSGRGRPAADLVGALSTPHAEAFLHGYEGIRPLQAEERRALPHLRVGELIRNLDFHLVDKVAVRGLDSIGEGWVDAELTALHEVSE